MSALVRALGAAAGGVSTGMDAAEAAAERKRKRDEDAEDRKYLMSERTRALNMRDQLGRAAAEVAPVEVKQDRPDTMDNRDVGAVGEAPLPTAGYDVAGKRFATKDEATTAAAAANTPQAVTTRMSDVLMRNGDPVQAQKLRTGAMQEQVGKFQLNDAMRADLDAQWNQEVDKKVTDWESMAQFYSDSAADGVGGKNKYQFLPSPDGKSQVAHLVLADGSLKPTEKAFPNTADGFAVAKAEMKRMPAERVLMHFFQKNQLAQQAERDAATAKYQEGMLKISQQNANTNEQYRRDQAAALKAKAAGAKPSGLDMDAADKFINALFTTKDETTGAHSFNPKGASAVRDLLPRMPLAQAGDTQGAVNQALTIYQTALKNAGGDHDKAVAMIRTATAPKPPQVGQVGQVGQPMPGQAPAPAAGPVTMAGRAAAAVDPLADDKRWVMNKLMGPFDSDAKLAEIARSNANPKFRAAAAELLKERRQRAATYGDEIQPQAL